MSPTTQIVFDTDIGTDIDDALALTLALASPEIDVIGVTVVDGDVDTRAQIAARLLGLAGRPDIPVFKGRSTPLGPGHMPTWLGHEGQGLLDVPSVGQDARIYEIPAADWLISEAKQRSYHLVAVGPFSNVAVAVQKDPEFPQRVQHLTVMGGLVHPETLPAPWHVFLQANNLPPAAVDHNTASDVTAAAIVARAGFSMTWVTAEITFCTPLHRRHVQRIKDTQSAFGQALARMLNIWERQVHHALLENPGYPNPVPPDSAAYLHDPLALSSLFESSTHWLVCKPHNLRFSGEGNLFHIREEDTTTAEAIHSVSVSVDNTRFENFFLERVTGYLEQLPN
ncbi:MAG: hypothetical protein HPY64_14820 [Anaerolineae bacterium]|nr:hypothetical protein [Anaerolineae bacterium]